MMNIEDFLKENLKQGSDTPPEGAWGEISSRMAAAARRRWRRAVALWTAVAIVAVVGMVALLSNRTAEDTIVAQNDLQPEVSVAPADNMTHGYVELQKEGKRATVVVEEERSSARSQTPPSVVEEEKEVTMSTRIVELESVAEMATVDSKRAVPTSHDDAETTENAIENSVAKAVAMPAEQTETIVREMETIEDHGNANEELRTLVIPNLITPNGDGYNDCWAIPDLSQYGRVQVQIYTAQSRRVFASNDYRGDFCGDDLPDGNYFYVLTIREIQYSRRGVLVIKRSH